MAKKKSKKEAAPKKKPKSKTLKSLKPFLGAFVVTAICLGFGGWLFSVYGWGQTRPSVTLTGWPLLGALAFVALLGLAYWRGGKSVFWGVLIGAGAVAALVTANARSLL